ncbi:nickel pincer cofactor biosynthesis protein LarB [Oryzomonas sagensis]|uniref:Nickel pincer cofactor biosynthesis protein LarB n=1 Tax=Oryzomonas sagensis TaxID=2603857 RepID=A0ABQ6TLF6_9BACT|nr:nickel pincer cofactor biosynthesis protein LarB [Oryzomonas sagensis]KAB0669094.1 nickel pincer cofactor biosynthesis protein LarB [Oryzomonas sagensis]
MDHGILFDHSRTARIGLPETVFCEGKPFEALVELLSRFGNGSGHPILFTRLAPEVFAQAPEAIRTGYDYHPLSRTAFGDTLPPKATGKVAVVSAGTSDSFVAWEAARTLAYLGIEHKIFEDCGVAGLWRLAERLEEINTFDALIVVAGLDAALTSVMGGLTPKPIFGVPTSAGYGVAQGGKAALASMLSSCAPGVAIMNIDNGYGAACAAARVVNGL